MLEKEGFERGLPVQARIPINLVPRVLLGMKVPWWIVRNKTIHFEGGVGKAI